VETREPATVRVVTERTYHRCARAGRGSGPGEVRAGETKKREEAIGFKDGERVFYLDEQGRVLGPFTIGIMDDGRIDLWYLNVNHSTGQRVFSEITRWAYEALDMKANLQPIEGDIGDHVHSIVDGEIFTQGDFVPVDVTRLRRVS
jgi:hypothetical protein